jgi:phosphoribosylanthranilate isomerase
VPDTMLSVAVCVGEPVDADTDLTQVYPEEDGHRAREGALLRNGEQVATVLDLPWLGEDDRHWERASSVAGRVLLAGGLGPENVHAAIAAVEPWCVDASRSLELAPGVKDHERVRAFVAAVRSSETVTAR